MLSYLKRLWKAAPVATVVLALSLSAASAFGVRTAFFYFYWHDPAHEASAVEGWMTPGYIAHSWNMPKHALLKAIGAPAKPPRGKPQSLKQLSHIMGISEDSLIEMAQSAVTDFKAQGTAHE